MEKHSGVSIQESGSSILTPDSWILDSPDPAALLRGSLFKTHVLELEGLAVDALERRGQPVRDLSGFGDGLHE